MLFTSVQDLTPTRDMGLMYLLCVNGNVFSVVKSGHN